MKPTSRMQSRRKTPINRKKCVSGTGAAVVVGNVVVGVVVVVVAGVVLVVVWIVVT